MAVYVDYTYYTGTWHGSAIAQTAFDRLAMLASAEVDQLTFDRAAGVVTAAVETDVIDKIKAATCAVAETLQNLEESGGAIASETIGRSSVTYHAPKSKKAQIADAARVWLWNTDLMYRGLNEDER